MRKPVHLYGASPQGLCASMLLCSRAGGCADELKRESLYVCMVRAHKDFVRCEPTRALYNVLVLAHQGFVQCTSMLVRACANELMYASLYICTVRAHTGFVLLCKRV